MKLKGIIFVAILGAWMFTSCKKEYLCECNWMSLGEQETQYTTYKARKSDAIAACERRMYQFSGIICEIK